MAEKIIEIHTNPNTGTATTTYENEKGETRQEFADKNGKSISDPRVKVDDNTFAEPNPTK